MVAVAVMSAITTGLLGDWPYAPVVGWDAAALLFSVWVWTAVIVPFSSTQTAAHATREDPGTAATELIVVIAAVASLAAVGFMLIKATSAHGASQDLLAGAGVGSVALSWFTVHSLFTLKYARLYYTGAHGGIDFNQKTPPRYVDFAYLAFTIGMTFQVSDTNLASREVRGAALQHALWSYLYGTAIVAGGVNLVAGLSK